MDTKNYGSRKFSFIYRSNWSRSFFSFFSPIYILYNLGTPTKIHLSKLETHVHLKQLPASSTMGSRVHFIISSQEKKNEPSLITRILRAP